MIEIDIEQIKVPSSVLRPINEKLVAELALSIEQIGLLQPIVVRQCGHAYETVFGNHRVEAFRRLGKKTIRAMVVEFTEDHAFLVRVSENLHRNVYVNPIEEAKGYMRLVKNGWTIHDVARQLGKSDGYVCDRMGILDRLDPRVRNRISKDNGALSPSHAELLSRIRNPDLQREIAEFIEKKRLSVRALEDMLNGTPPPIKVRIERDGDDYVLTIPRNYIEAVDISVEQYIHLYIRGMKLVLENLDRPRRHKFTRVNSRHV